MPKRKSKARKTKRVYRRRPPVYTAALSIKVDPELFATIEAEADATPPVSLTQVVRDAIAAGLPLVVKRRAKARAEK